MSGKAWWKSKTLWLNGLVAFGAVVEANFGMIRDHIGPQWYVLLIGIVACVNAILRTITSEPIGKGE